MVRIKTRSEDTHNTAEETTSKQQILKGIGKLGDVKGGKWVAAEKAVVCLCTESLKHVLTFLATINCYKNFNATTMKIRKLENCKQFKSNIRIPCITEKEKKDIWTHCDKFKENILR